MKRLAAATVALMAAAGIGSAARADEPIFGYIYTTDVLPKGQKEIEQWVTLREGRSQGDFHVWQGRTEFSYGVTDNFQLSAYLNYAHAETYHNAPDGTTAPPEIFAEYSPGPDDHFNEWRSEGISVEGIYRFKSPYTDGYGLALYVEPTFAPNTRELELRLLAQKNFIDDRLVLAANLTVGFEKRRLPGDPSEPPGSPESELHWDKETDVNFGLAASYRFMPNWSAGLEFQNEREWAGFDPFNSDNRTNVAYYLGPTLHYGGQHFFMTGTVLAQLDGAEDHSGGVPSFVVNGISNADDFEKVRVRFKAGYYF